MPFHRLALLGDLHTAVDMEVHRHPGRHRGRHRLVPVSPLPPRGRRLHAVQGDAHLASPSPDPPDVRAAGLR